MGTAPLSLEYRRIGNERGGWPGPIDDVRAGAELFRQLATQVHIDPRRIVVMVHSAGGHLALWLAGELMSGSPEQFPERYKMASPIERLRCTCPRA